MRQRLGEILKRDRAVLHAPRNEAEGLRQSPQTRIGGQRAEKGLRPDQLIGRGPHLVHRQEQQSVGLEERAARRIVDGLDLLGLVGQRRAQRFGGAVGEFRRRPIDDHKQRVRLMRKGGIELQLTLAPRQVRRDQLAGIGLDGEVPARIGAGANRQQRRDQQRRDRIGATGPDQTGDACLKKWQSCRCHRICLSMRGNALECLGFFAKSRFEAKSLDPARLSRANAHNHRGSICS